MKRLYLVLLAGTALLLGACSQIVGAPLEEGDYDATVTMQDSDGNEEEFDFSFTVDEEGAIEDDSYDFDYEGAFVDMEVHSNTGNNRIRVDGTIEYEFLGTVVVHSHWMRSSTRSKSADSTTTSYST